MPFAPDDDEALRDELAIMGGRSGPAYEQIARQRLGLAKAPPMAPVRPAAGGKPIRPSELRSLLDGFRPPVEPTPMTPTEPRPNDELEALKRAQNAENNQAMSDRIGGALYSAFTRTPLRAPPQSATPTEQFGQQRALLGGQRQQAAAEAAQLKTAELDDPGSEASRSTQALVASTFPDIAKRLGPSLQKLSHAKAIQVFPFLKEASESAIARAKAEADAAKLDAAAEQQRLENERNAANDKFGRDKFAEDQRHNKAMEGIGWQRRDDAANNPSKAAKPAGDLRKEFNLLPQVKDYRNVAVAFDKVKRSAADPSAAGDLSLIFAYMKMLDPGSSVREGEFANAQNAGGIDAKIAGAYNNILNGQRLNPDQRKDFITQAGNLMGSHRQPYLAAVGQYRGLAEKYGVDPDDVVQMEGGPEASPASPRQQASAGAAGSVAPQPSAQDRAALDWLKGNQNDPAAEGVRARLKKKGLL